MTCQTPSHTPIKTHTHIHTQWPPRVPICVMGAGQQEAGGARRSGCRKRHHHSAERVSLLSPETRKRRKRLCSWPLTVPRICWGWRDGGIENKKGGGGRRRSTISQFTGEIEPVVVSWGRGENLSPHKNVREKNTSGRRGEEGWGLWMLYMWHHSLSSSLFLSLPKAKEHLQGSPH